MHFAIVDEFASMLSVDVDFKKAEEGVDGITGIQVLLHRTGKKWVGKKTPRHHSWRKMRLFEERGMVVSEIVSRGKVFRKVRVELENPRIGEVFDLVYGG
ncbi:uncharacterized protein MYCFIDRAFT_212471 [Pseudocercospora fijiensis CIRAD86]|uniref:Uncharacterized protein n=1 Tax=Pseudocercospora fijiensis (strain CIRAD86) TaxID=383855 RepID=M2ZI44_PSEFD|nr:uncharacterized protein MYCFIDRAFT_212471 [Pseudocercospora fijiensis CIRAD86]EME78764.1 hypothetical protein MYCFIDRAFT_212471 [Pseudocercospora fijiensis CIRAD86]